ncbi:MAG: DUF262 domain-containing protein [Chloroflexota bacterium]
MNDNQSQTESLLDIVKGIQSQSIMLPEFQRDFRWELEQTYDLFDSLIREIFIGTLIYGKPSFGMTLREIDTRPRKGKGSSKSLQTYNFTTEEIRRQTQTENLRVVLDGQQRITSVYRAITGIDKVYIVLAQGLDEDSIKSQPLEKIFVEVSGEESPTAISVKLFDAYEAEMGALEEDEDFNRRFGETTYARRFLSGDDDETKAKRRTAEKIYRRAIRKLTDLYKQQKMVAYYLLDMSLDKFCIFFERSNSRGIQLNFTDILAAKLYHGFNLRKKIEEFEGQNKYKLNREIIVRSIAYVSDTERGATPSIDKKSILDKLDADNFETHWDKTCNLYVGSMNYLTGQNYVLSQDWIPSENMIVPLMIFRRYVKGFDRITEDQRRFIEYWYWASIFANRYSAASNEVIIADSQALSQIARGEKVTTRGYFSRMRPLIASPDDLLSYSKKTSAIYRGVLNLLGYSSQGLMDWSSEQKINASMRLEDHHIFPRAYITSGPSLDMDQSEAEQLVDSVVNRTLIPKLLNIQVGKKAPQVYLSELKKKTNPRLDVCLSSHLIPKELIDDPDRNFFFEDFLKERARAIFELIERYVLSPAAEIVAKHGVEAEEVSPLPNSSRLRLKDMITLGRVRGGDRIHVKRHPDRPARIIDGDTVEFEGERVAINTWGQRVAGWSSINIYEHVVLERTGQTLEELRNGPTK